MRPESGDTTHAGWEQVGDIWFHKAPSATIEEFASGRRGFVSVSCEGGRHVMRGLSGEFVHGSLEDAMSAADRMMREIVDGQPAAFLAQAELDPEDWEFRHEGRFVWFRYLHRDGRVERHMDRKWVACLDDARIGIAATPAAAARLVAEAIGRVHAA